MGKSGHGNRPCRHEAAKPAALAEDPAPFGLTSAAPIRDLRQRHDASRPRPTLLLFGPQALSFNRQSLSKLQHTVPNDSVRQWMLNTVAGLPKYWDALSQKLPEVAAAVPGPTHLGQLGTWLQGSLDDAPETDTLPSIVLTPLVVIGQLLQYWRYLQWNQWSHGGARSTEPDLQTDFLKKHTEQAETLGFCTGLLSAFAVASASSQGELERYGAVAVRLAMLIGALIDAQEASNHQLGQGLFKSYATSWQSPEQSAKMTAILNDFSPDAYISVLYDETRATVTTVERTAASVVEQLRAAGITVAQVGLRGNFHSPQAEQHTMSLVELVQSRPDLQFPDASAASLPTYTNAAGGERLSAGKLHEIAIRSILLEQCNWHRTISQCLETGENVSAVSFGPGRFVPPSLVPRLSSRLLHFADLDEASPKVPPYQPVIDTNAIAVVGLSIKVAGADDADEFTRMLQTGESQHELITPERLNFETLWRQGDWDPSRKWYGNFIRDSDAFDHKFFKRSPRESSTMDPQQRLYLQAAYQAVEQSGYFSEVQAAANDGKPCRPGSSLDRQHVGVYVGGCTGDYEHHVACHPANAFTATGNLRSFIAGKVSHFFGWTGPAMMFDTACSASTVALHTACTNLLSGECNAALAGGVSTMTNPLWFQNLAGATFLSPTGQCKPFDELADGYCRAEAIGCVFLKRMSDAVRDGNPILGTIASSAVYQNQNCTPIFVPNSPSLSQLFGDVLHKANLTPDDISVVEAHGTGTPVGDPAEYESVRLALGDRTQPVIVGSAKGHVGHAEGASGIVSLAKVLVMMQEGFIPPQASFTKMSHHIKATDLIRVSTSLQPWTAEYKAALINNYGASGSNASMIVTQSPYSPQGQASAPIRRNTNPVSFPFWITGYDARSIGAYAAKLKEYLNSRSTPPLLADVSFNVNKKSNRTLPQGLIFSARSVADLTDKLNRAAASPADSGVAAVKAEPPVILCFGGQVSTFVGLDRNLYESMPLLRHHLDQCDAVVQSLGLKSIYPDIFSRTPLVDPLQLQTILFCFQYACAQSWIDSGISTRKIVSVVGHSFGEITALCVSGVLSLPDTIRLVTGRAQLVRDAWGDDSGAMMAVEADDSVIHELLETANKVYGGEYPASIACYNGPRSFTLAGSSEAIQAVIDTIPKQCPTVRNKKLNVTNAFHSTLVEPLRPKLEEVGRTVSFQEPVIPLERATETRFNGKLTAQFVADHMRRPVFFNHAVQRLAQEHPSAIWLEAGSSSTITLMASRALGNSASPGHHFQALSLTNDKGLDGLTDATVSLWKHGLQVSFWAHHARQTAEYASLLLPPYQFDKSRHWLELKRPSLAIAAAGLTASTTGSAAEPGIFTFVGYQDEDRKGKQSNALFRINTSTERYQKYLKPHVIAQTAPICPATLEIDIAIEALFSLRPEWVSKGLLPVVCDMVNQVPICADNARSAWLELAALDDSQTVWSWKIISSSSSSNSKEGATVHAEGRIRIRSPDEAAYQAEFARYEWLVTHKQCTGLLDLANDSSASDEVEIIQGRNVYRAFSDVVDYGDIFRGLQRVVGRGDESAGRVTRKHSSETWLDVALIDGICQVGGLFVNCMTDRPAGDMYIATGIEMMMRSPRITRQQKRPDVCHVLAHHRRQSDKVFLTDLFIFDPVSGTLTDIVLGIHYARVAKMSMSKLLNRLTTDETMLVKGSKSRADESSKATSLTIESPAVSPPSHELPTGGDTASKTKKPKSKNDRPDITDDVRKLVANISGIEADEITLDSELADFGIDSLMGMEVAREVETVFKCTLDQEALMDATSLRKFVVVISDSLYGPASNTDADNDDDDSQTSSDGVFTPGEDSASETSQDTSPPPSQVDPPAKPKEAISSAPAVSNLSLSQSDILGSFGDVKMLADQAIRNHGMKNFDQSVAASNRMCTALVIDAMEQLGWPLRTATEGQVLPRVPFLPQHGRMMEFVYQFLEQVARLVNIDPFTGEITRTSIPLPKQTSNVILQELLQTYPELTVANLLTHYAGLRLADVLSGKTDGIRVIFGSPEGRELVKGLYCDYTLNRVHYANMRDVIGRLVDRKLSDITQENPLKILEMGAGTGGTTIVLAPFLASLDIPVEYTFTDLSPSMVANARRTFGAKYPFMRFAVHNIEKEPTPELRGQHIVIASNAIHATHSLKASAEQVRVALRDDGFLMVLEMVESLPWIDVIFGLLEGWWLFDDGRPHAIAPPEVWERDLHAAGFGHVDWTDGTLPEHNFEKLILATASGGQLERLPKPTTQAEGQAVLRDVEAVEKEAEEYVAAYTAGFSVTPSNEKQKESESGKAVVVVTGATGSLGSHIVANLAENPTVQSVICINRRTGTAAETRQDEAFSKRGIEISSDALQKLRVFQTTASQPQLGLPASEYTWLVENVTHIIHNAWPMSTKRPLSSFEPQFQTLRNLLDLASAAGSRPDKPRIGFQFVSSIGVVGHSGHTRVPEERMRLGATIDNGYCEAKWVCERMLDETLHKNPETFRAMVIRPGQITGSRTSGIWNPLEHFPFLVKSAQALRSWPDFDGILQWVPVNDVAGTMVDLLHLDDSAHAAYPVYHIDNPVGQPWKEMSATLCDALDIPKDRIIPFAEWVKLVRRSPLQMETDNPAARLIDFLDSNFERMSCGGLILDTTLAREHSATLAAQGPVSADVARSYVDGWKRTGFLA
ncbi:putative polyketide synthase [Aspergillus lucknowensis]|uniref:Polyketide synthase n=1 Tax=Aspergillus lucknowensis TaxID=176173 RepID=A0ABR4LDF3_9EURO